METMLANTMNLSPVPFSVLGGHDRAFSDLLAELKAELAPIGLVEALMVDRVLLAVSRLRSIVADAGVGDPDAMAQAEQSIDRALEALGTARSARSQGWGHAAVRCSRVGDVSSLAPLAAASDPIPSRTNAEVDANANSDADADAAPADGHWRDRLTFDESVSDESPVVRGTWVTACQVISLIVDDWTWDDILRNYPELTERDIRACLAYTVEQDGPISL